jgi:DedD protein
MALFKTRKGGDEPQATHRQPESVEAVRKRARHRLIGAGVLVLIAIVGFPVLFDTQPRPIAVDIPIEIPDRNKVQPLPAAPPPPAQPPVVSGPVTVAPAPSTPAAVAPAAPDKVAAATPPAPQPEAAREPKPQINTEIGAEAKPEPKAQAAARPETKSEAKSEARSTDAARARALLEGKPVQVAAAADEGRYVVQVGAFADAAKARETRLKVERAGLKTYTQVAETSEGKRTRVRVGPFGSRAEADRAAGKIKGLHLPAAILSL